ncbi:unnamed protein product, partial [marine sediment metagenome]
MNDFQIHIDDIIRTIGRAAFADCSESEKFGLVKDYMRNNSPQETWTQAVGKAINMHGDEAIGLSIEAWCDRRLS